MLGPLGMPLPYGENEVASKIQDGRPLFMQGTYLCLKLLLSHRIDSFISYLLNPYLVFPSLALSTSTFDNALYVLVLTLASQGNVCHIPTFECHLTVQKDEEPLHCSPSPC